MKLIIINTGITVKQEDFPAHPLLAAKSAYEMIQNFSKDIAAEKMEVYTNQCDAVSTLYYVGIGMGIKINVFVDGKKSTLNSAFGKWNKAIAFQRKIFDNLEKKGRRKRNDGICDKR